MMHTKLRTFAAAVALALAVCAGAWAQVAGQAPPPWSPGTLDIHRISTGKGDAVFYIFPDGTTMLVDPGATGRQGPRVTAQRPDASRTPGEWVVRYIRRMLAPGSKPALDYALLTHFHGDHMGDLCRIRNPRHPGSTGSRASPRWAMPFRSAS